MDSVSVNDVSSVPKPTKRRHTADSKNKHPKNQHFYFVDQNSSSKEKRAHVMRHHVQEKRKQHKTSRTAHSVDSEAAIARYHQPGTSTPAAQASDLTTSVRDSPLLALNLSHLGFESDKELGDKC
ncbi:unnamed protein product [Penicillium salamii]|nr:unnamed protein product [Penicillium salamii]CAG8427895.1 unnamed protein product [Penicillium salamii]